MESIKPMTRRQEQIFTFLQTEGLANSRRVAGEFGMRSQDAGRSLRALERAGRVEFYIGRYRAGFRVAQ